MSQLIRYGSKVKPATHTLIFMHGLGDTGEGWGFLATQLREMPEFQSMDFVFPTAPITPITANGGVPMTGWFDLLEWDPEMKKFDVAGFQKTLLTLVPKYIQKELNNGIPASNIILGGFSQGAAIALGAAACLSKKIGGFISLSGFVSPAEKELWDKLPSNDLNKTTPIFHGHGESDPVVSLKKGQEARDFMVNRLGFQNYELHTYKGLEHSMSPNELTDLVQFIKRLFQL
ncbi:palmitoyl-(protein) hydrolase KNAG_0G02370 [Huiozyma naganishii CBS 8797]|uniref:Acyl-protein thioesterase 1 n=1 Tax=Huiozyma naganishii (strain ATCC MYA-139 / BCRC 22969 / CBS 8797 / KCTC 17520 / NBRC 10181 / NCYC 3082 / Yp74L-3) TaxID=1071383 RepID=J7R8U7_HUIN7|nr:hypothetical protein KNAG_0G02370 [Kazachstania naganishii CBS 8797]CCK71295.1 hypothetical protein KNAG_0G02370 [Kazachstania naganishii CBS 8797]